MSAVVHARSLLSKMASTHPAATMADKMLRREIETVPANRASNEASSSDAGMTTWWDETRQRR